MKEIIKIKLIDKSRIIDSKNGYRLFLKDSTSYNGFTIKNVNGHYEAYFGEEFIVSGDTESEVKKELDLLPKKKQRRYAVWFPNDVYGGPLYLNSRGQTTFVEEDAKKYLDFDKAQKKADYRRKKIDGRNWKVRTYEI